SKAKIIQVRRTGKGCLSYFVAGGTEAIVVDAAVDPEVYLRIAKDRGLTIRYVADTHIHADHLSRSRALAERCGAGVLLPMQKRATYPFRGLDDGEVLTVGGIPILTIHTPGHTMESACYLVDGKALL